MNPDIAVRLAYLLGIVFNATETPAWFEEELARCYWSEDLAKRNEQVLMFLHNAELGARYPHGANWREITATRVLDERTDALQCVICHHTLPYQLNVRFAFNENEQVMLSRISVEWTSGHIGSYQKEFTDIFRMYTGLMGIIVRKNTNPENALLWPELVRTLHAVAETGWMNTESLIDIRRSLDAIAMAEQPA